MKNLISKVVEILAPQGLQVDQQEIKRAYWRGAKQKIPITSQTTELQAHKISEYLIFNSITSKINQI